MTNEQTVDALEFAEELRTLAADIFADAAQDLPDTVARPLSTDVWNVLGETGLARLTGASASGGSEAGWAEASVVLGEAAAAGVPIPLLEHDLLAGWLRDTAGLPAGDPATLATTAEVVAPGRAVTVPWVETAGTVVVLDRTGGQPRVYEIAADALEINVLHSVSGEPRATVTFPTSIDGAVEVSEAVAQEWLFRGALGRAAQIAGAAESISRLCVEHVTTRVQFGRPIGKFQAVQQLVTDVASEAALTRMIVDRAVLTVVERGFDDEGARFLVAAAKACAGGAAEKIVRNAHQIHGAIGTTLEHPLQRRTRPITGWRREFGSTAVWEQWIENRALEADTDLWDLITA